jgi:hypothetical protein
MKELNEAEIQVTNESRELLVSLDEKQKELNEYQTNIINIKKYASDLQTFIAVKQIEKDVETHDTCLQSLVNSDSLNQTKLTYKIHTGLKNITSKEQPLISLSLVFIVCIRFSCIFSTDMGGDSSATISWACLYFLRTKTISQGFDSTTTLANF